MVYSPEDVRKAVQIRDAKRRRESNHSLELRLCKIDDLLVDGKRSFDLRVVKGEDCPINRHEPLLDVTEVVLKSVIRAYEKRQWTVEVISRCLGLFKRVKFTAWCEVDDG